VVVDIIGDIHGQADKTEALLQSLGYNKRYGVYRHPNRSALFLGDLIDRGSQNRGVIDIIRPMVQDGHAQVILGNHEYNAICFHSSDPETGQPLRAHNDKNLKQHASFLKEFPINGSETLEVIEWFKTLPLFLDLGEFRVVHAAWDQNAVQAIGPCLGPNKTLTDALLRASVDPTSLTYRYVETLLKGPEIILPQALRIEDKSGHVRKEQRIKWWELNGPKSFRNLALARTELVDRLPDHEIHDISLPVIYPADDPPVFFGHYSLDPISQHPVQSPNTICLDFSGHIDPPITAYSWNGNLAWDESRLIRM
jgi:hypothetical protein